MPGESFELPEDFIYIGQEWGSLFYKHHGKMSRNDAKQTCSKYGPSVHLPIPRFPSENQFYLTHFGNTSLWLGLSDEEQDGLYKTDDTNTLLHFVIDRPDGEISGSRYKWTETNFALNGKSTGTSLSGVKLSNVTFNEPNITGLWQMEDENDNELDTICVYNIIPNECDKCPDKNFCRLTDRSRKEVECICPIVKGENCDTDLCDGLQCFNGGECFLNNREKPECFCPYPFHGKHCESCKLYHIDILYSLYRLYVP